MSQDPALMSDEEVLLHFEEEMPYNMTLIDYIIDYYYIGFLSLIPFLIFMLWKYLYALKFRKEKRKIKIENRNTLEYLQKELKELLEKSLSQNEFYFEFTYLARKFIEIQYNLNATEKTTKEILSSHLFKNIAHEDIKNNITEILRKGDEIKFAYFSIEKEEEEKHINFLNQIIQKTIQEKNTTLEGEKT